MDESAIRRAAEFTLQMEGEDASEVSIRLTDDEEIRRLNREYRDHDQPTDVLAFAMREGEDGVFHPSLLGDVVISVETAQRQAAASGGLKQELNLLTVHGVLHLLGYDHERPEDAVVMEAKQKQVLRRLLQAPVNEAGQYGVSQ